MSLMPSTAWQEVWEATERTLQCRAAYTSVRQSSKNCTKSFWKKMQQYLWIAHNNNWIVWAKVPTVVVVIPTIFWQLFGNTIAYTYRMSNRLHVNSWILPFIYIISIQLFVLRCQIPSEKSTDKSGNLTLEKYGILNWEMCRNPEYRSVWRWCRTAGKCCTMFTVVNLFDNFSDHWMNPYLNSGLVTLFFFWHRYIISRLLLAGFLCKPDVWEVISELKKLPHFQVSGLWHKWDMTTEIKFKVSNNK